MAWICDKNGNHKCEVKKLSYNGVFMEVSSITVTIESPAPIDFAIGDYIDWDCVLLRMRTFSTSYSGTRTTS